jgi:hypothetical protein
MQNKTIAIIGDSQSHFFTHLFKKTEDFIREYKNITHNGAISYGSESHQHSDLEILFIWRHGKRGGTLKQDHFVKFLDESMAGNASLQAAVFVFGTVDVILHLNPIVKSGNMAAAALFAKDMAKGYVESVLELAEKYKTKPFVVLPIVPSKGDEREVSNEMFNAFLIKEMKKKKIKNVINIFDVVSKRFISEPFDHWDHHLNKSDLELALRHILNLIKKDII